jgi:hypothetical protein
MTTVDIEIFVVGILAILLIIALATPASKEYYPTTI